MFTYQREESWPPLAWLASCDENVHLIMIHHGTDVATRQNWFCEAAWDDDYTDGNFDQTSTVFGTGGRIRDGLVYFVSSSFPGDGLRHIKINGTQYLSNSLVCLTAFLDLHVDPWYPWYYEDFHSIDDGLDHYKNSIHTSRGDVKLTYYKNLLWDNGKLTETDKATTDSRFHNFDTYHEFLKDTLQRLASNMHSAERPFSYDSISTSSSGYDSLAVTVLSRQLGTREVLCVPEDRIGLDDSGIELIEQLNMQALPLMRDAWRKEPFAEVSFIAGDACGRDAWLFAARDRLSRRLLLTGYFGDSIWSLKQAGEDSKPPPISSLGGLSLTEFRLQAGFIHCPIAYLGLQAIDKIREIGCMDDMQAWVTSGQYNRPVPRRIVEQAGLQRGRFALRKTAVNVHLFRRHEFDRFLAKSVSFRDYMQWLRKQSHTIQPSPVEDYPRTTSLREVVEVPLFRHLFPWALEHAKKRYLKPENSQ